MPASVGELCWGSADVVGVLCTAQCWCCAIALPKNVMGVLEKSTAAVHMMLFCLKVSDQRQTHSGRIVWVGIGVQGSLQTL